MTVEEMEFWLKHPKLSADVVRAWIAQQKAYDEVQESVKRAEESGMVAQFVPIRSPRLP